MEVRRGNQEEASAEIQTAEVTQHKVHNTGYTTQGTLIKKKSLDRLLGSALNKKHSNDKTTTQNLSVKWTLSHSHCNKFQFDNFI